MKTTQLLLITEDGGICHKDTGASFGIHTIAGDHQDKEVNYTSKQLHKSCCT